MPPVQVPPPTLRREIRPLIKGRRKKKKKRRRRRNIVLAALLFTFSQSQVYARTRFPQRVLHQKKRRKKRGKKRMGEKNGSGLLPPSPPFPLFFFLHFSLCLARKQQQQMKNEPKNAICHCSGLSLSLPLPILNSPLPPISFSLFFAFLMSLLNEERGAKERVLYIIFFLDFSFLLFFSLRKEGWVGKEQKKKKKKKTKTKQKKIATAHVCHFLCFLTSYIRNTMEPRKKEKKIPNRTSHFQVFIPFEGFTP
eukprot:TRINITY_DN395_c0_g1_i1.p1 TRINITY_DN395_c0_g1~~TRINITY_DN395_c0_g1_i1.p1  ORF type:complete len:252 (+),score=11.90 TRINITY_DN395_c0_g1_i1:161-916(+)